MKLTKEEQEMIRKLRGEKEGAQPVMQGFVKEDLYVLVAAYPIDSDDADCGLLFTKAGVEKAVGKVRRGFQICIPKGSRFLAWREGGKLVWTDDINYGMEEQPDEWAKKFLENITPFKKDRKQKKV